MTYAPAENLLRLDCHLAATRTGLTLDEMAGELGAGRRTAERMRDTLAVMFPQMGTRDDEGRLRRWLLPASGLVGILDVPAEAVAAIETSARECEVRGEADCAALLREASLTLRAVMRPDTLRRAEPDIGALMEAEGVAMRPGPRRVLAAGVLATVRRAILGVQLVVVRHLGPEAAEPVARLLCPYGIIDGGCGWLVAHVDGLPHMRLWQLDRIVSADLLERGFTRREDFDLVAYAAQSFAVFQEEPIDVLLRFELDAAEDAAGWLFHPTQTAERETDGALIVRLHAGGVRELCWHLFTWGTAVTMVAPDSLRAQMSNMTVAIGQHHKIFELTNERVGMETNHVG